MCIICVSKPGVRQPDENTIRTMFYRNPHGAGYMFARDGRVEIRKGFMRLDEYLRAIREERFTAADSVVYHFRISTQAGVNPEMTHPFPLSNRPARLCADAEVVDHVVADSEVFLADGPQVIVQIHEALVDRDPAVAREHVPRAVGIVQEHGADGGLAGLADAGFGYADDAHVKLPPCWMFWCIWKRCGSRFESVSACAKGHPGAGLRSVRVNR